MASQAEKDTAAAKAKQGGGQAAKDTAAAKAKQNTNNQAAKDTARAKSRQNGGDGGTSARMSQREAAAGLYLAGNDTISAGRGGVGPTFSDREAANGLTNTISGRVSLKATNPDFPQVGTPAGNDYFVSTSNVSGGGGGGGLAGIEIIWADQTITYIRASDMFVDYDPTPVADGGAGDLYWSLVLDVVDGVFDNAPVGGFTYDEVEDIFEDDGATPPVQTKYRFRLITQGIDSEGDPVNTPISMYGQYREVTTCINGSPFQRLTKVT